MFLILAICNALLISDKSFALIEFLLVIVCLIVLCVGKLIRFFRKKDSNDFIAKTEMLMIIAAVPLFAMVLAENVDKNIYSIVLLFSLAEMVVVILLLGGFRIDVANIIIENSREKFFVYKRLDEERLLCGDDRIMKEATQILVIAVNDVISGEYFLRYYKEEDVEEKSSKEA